MPQYLTEQELIDGYLPGDVAERSSPAERNLWIDIASSEADGYLRSAGYVLPLTLWGDALSGQVGSIAAYRLASKLGLVPQPAKDSDLYLNFKAALAWLKGIAEGSISVEVTDSDTGGVEPSQGPLVDSEPPRGW